MAFLVIVVNTSDSIADLNAKVQSPTKPYDALNKVTDYVDSILAGAKDASVQVTTRSTDPAVGTAGSGSTQQTYNLK